MKVISLLQPWATLVVMGKKMIETRSWNTNHRGPILIHASKRMDAGQRQLLKKEPFKTAVTEIKDLPLGKILGKVDIIQTSTTEFFKQCSEAIPLRKRWNEKEWKDELAFGDYSPGRYGWLLDKAIEFSHQPTINGARGLWDLDYRICLGCGCTNENCIHCIKKTGQPCYWVEENLCSACAQ